MQRIAMWQVQRWRMQEAVMHTTICSRFYLFTCGIELTKALSENFLHIAIQLQSAQMENIRIQQVV